jgi:hypothetical protein
MSVFFEKLESLINHCDRRYPKEVFISEDDITFTVFGDGDILHLQGALSGKGEYTNCDKHDGHHRYWGGDPDSTVLLSYHDGDNHKGYPYIGLHFLDTHEKAVEAAKDYSGHYFILLAKLSEGNEVNKLQVLDDQICISRDLTGVTWKSIATHLAKTSNLALSIVTSVKQRTAWEEFDQD